VKYTVTTLKESTAICTYEVEADSPERIIEVIKTEGALSEFEHRMVDQETIEEEIKGADVFRNRVHANFHEHDNDPALASWSAADTLKPITAPLRTAEQRKPYVKEDGTIECVAAIRFAQITLLIHSDDEPGGEFDQFLDTLSEYVTGSVGGLTCVEFCVVGGDDTGGCGTVHIRVKGYVEEDLLENNREDT